MSDNKGKYIVFKSKNRMVSREICRESNGAYKVDEYTYVKKSQVHKICENGIEAQIYRRTCEELIYKIKEEDKYKKLRDAKIDAICAFNAYKKQKETDIIGSVMDIHPEYFI